MTDRLTDICITATASQEPRPAAQALYRSAAIRAFEQDCLARMSAPEELMQRAASALAGLVVRVAGSRRELVGLIGPGNNGGDVSLACRRLQAQGFLVTLFVAPENLSAFNKKGWGSGLQVVTDLESLGTPELILDGLFGIGLNRPVDGVLLRSILWANDRPPPTLRIAADLPSGLGADSGQVIQPGACFQAHYTASFLLPAVGLYTGAASDLVGERVSFNLGMTAPNHIPHAALLLDQALAARYATGLKRANNSHKGRFGSVGVVGGASGMTGAALLAARAAAAAGAGKTFLAALDQEAANSTIGTDPELMRCEARQLCEGSRPAGCLAVGPGLGFSKEAVECLSKALDQPCPLVLDADALTLIGQQSALAEKTAARFARGWLTVMTPHPTEAARLLQTDTEQVQSDRLGQAKALNTRYQAVIVLKGAGSVIAAGEETWINLSGSPALSVGGTGDVLTGLIAGLLAQGLPAAQAACLAVSVHGSAAELLGQTSLLGMKASELVLACRDHLNLLVRG